MNKKPTESSSEPIKLTVSEVQPEESLVEEPLVVPEEAVAGDPNLVVPKSDVDDLFPSPDKMEIQKPKRSPKGGFWGFVGGLLIGGLAIGGIFGFIINPKSAGNRREVNGVISVPTSVVEPTPEVTVAVEEVDYSQYSVKVLNGSGVDGAAASVKELIKEIAFKSVQTGNASVSNLKETTVQFKAGVPVAVFEKVSQLLVKYTVVEGDALEDSAGVDIQITVGIQKY